MGAEGSTLRRLDRVVGIVHYGARRTHAVIGPTVPIERIVSFLKKIAVFGFST
jgi:hypothetical protein